MIPLKDDIPNDRFPAVTVVLIAALAIEVVALDGPLLALAAAALCLWLFGGSVEEAAKPVGLLLLCLLGGAAALGLQALAGAEPDVRGAGVAGAVSAVVGAHLLLYPRARVLTAVLVPFFFTLVAVPALLVVGVWAVLQALLTSPAALGGLVVGLAAASLLARGPRPAVPAPYRG